LKHVDFFFCGGVLFDFIFEVVRENEGIYEAVVFSGV
jgi:hypothetical protein